MFRLRLIAQLAGRRPAVRRTRDRMPWYRNEMTDTVMPMPAASASITMPNYGNKALYFFSHHMHHSSAGIAVIVHIEGGSQKKSELIREVQE
jgi:hypothetical protein